jgi:sigma-E factor negative regulatory protein RseA
MSDSPRERVSALMDGELPRADETRVLESVADSADLQRTWERYHLIRDVLQKELARMPQLALLERVRRDLEAEPKIYRLALFRKETLRPLAGLALAASVAVVAVIGFRGQVAGTARSADLVASAGPRDAGSAAVGAEVGQSDPRLDAYLVKHSERANGFLQGAMPYARLVTYDASR